MGPARISCCWYTSARAQGDAVIKLADYLARTLLGGPRLEDAILLAVTVGACGVAFDPERGALVFTFDGRVSHVEATIGFKAGP